MNFSGSDWQAIVLTLKLASIVTLILLVVSTPLAIWLAYSKSKIRTWVNALVAMPLVLPPTVLGFYLLMLLGPAGPIGKASEALGVGLLPFSFGGLVVASIFYSLPFVVQPLTSAFNNVGRRPVELASVLGASRWDTFCNVLFPLVKPGFITAAVLGFAHTVGEFGVILMIGGNIPGETRVLSIALFDHVEAFDYAKAHVLAISLLAGSMVLLASIYLLNSPRKKTLNRGNK